MLRDRATPSRQPPCDPIACIACQMHLQPCTKPEAFVGGMLFVLEHTKEAVLKQLCRYHQHFMLAGYVHTRDMVAKEDRR